jgi:hypothetical protein
MMPGDPTDRFDPGPVPPPPTPDEWAAERREAAYDVVQALTQLRRWVNPWGPPLISHDEAVAVETVMVMARAIQDGTRTLDADDAAG